MIVWIKSVLLLTLPLLFVSVEANSMDASGNGDCFKCKGNLTYCLAKEQTCNRSSSCRLSLNFTRDGISEEDELQLDAGCFENSTDDETVCTNTTQLLQCLQQRKPCTFCCETDLCNWAWLDEIRQFLDDDVETSNSTTQENSEKLECFSCSGNLTQCLEEDNSCSGSGLCVLSINFANESLSLEDDLQLEAGCMENSTDQGECMNTTELLQCLQERTSCIFCCESNWCNRAWLDEIRQFRNESIDDITVTATSVTPTTVKLSTDVTRHRTTTQEGSEIDECFQCRGSRSYCLGDGYDTCHRTDQCVLALNFTNDNSMDDDGLLLDAGCRKVDFECANITEMRQCVQERRACTFCCNTTTCSGIFILELPEINPISSTTRAPTSAAITTSRTSTQTSVGATATSVSTSTPSSTRTSPILSTVTSTPVATSASGSTASSTRAQSTQSSSTPSSTSVQSTARSSSGSTLSSALTTGTSAVISSSSAASTSASVASASSTQGTSLSSQSTSASVASSASSTRATSSPSTSATVASNASSTRAASSQSTSTTVASSASSTRAVSSQSTSATVASSSSTTTAATGSSVSNGMTTLTTRGLSDTTSQISQSTTTSSTCSTIPPLSLATTRSAETTGHPREDPLYCFECLNESSAVCKKIETVKSCGDGSLDWCYSTITNVEGKFMVNKGCMAKETCLGRASNNSVNCQYGTVTDSCTWCCEDSVEDQGCNIEKLDYSVTEPDTSCPTTPASPCGVNSYQDCLVQFKQHVLDASLDPDIQFNQFCRAVPDVYQCISAAMEGCNSCEKDWAELNATLSFIFGNMSSECPVSCDVDAGYNCSNSYYFQVLWLLINDLPGYCTEIFKIQFEQNRCRLKTIGSCDVSVRRSLNVSFTAIDIASSKLCPIHITTPPPVTESPKCSISSAAQCILDFGYQIVAYFNSNGDVNVICRTLKIQEECYRNVSASCSDGVQLRLDSAWNFTYSLVAELCIVAERPICSTSTARSCVLNLWNLIEEVQDFKSACEQLSGTISCVVKQMAGCTPIEQRAMNSSLQMVVDKIGNRCTDFIEIKYENETIEITEGRPCVNFSYIFNNPPSSICAGSEVNCKIYIEIEIGVEKSYPRCRNGSVIQQAVLEGNGNETGNLCNRQVTETNWNITQEICIAAKVDFKYDGVQKSNLVVWFRKEVNGTRTERRSLQNFTLIINDGDKKSVVCSSINDPHTTTFDGWYYNNFLEGFFVLYRHKTLPYEVQIATQRCNGAASCNCAVGIRSGDTVLYIDRCRKKSIFNLICKITTNKYLCPNLMKISLWGYNSLITPGTRLITRNFGKEFIVIFPHGTTVRIAVNGDYLNVWVTPSPVDFKLTEGLCGSYDQNRTNDLALRNGSDFRGKDYNKYGGQPNDFTGHWRVTVAEDIYQGVKKQTYTPPWYCECKADTAKDSEAILSKCSPTALFETCDMDTSGELIDSSRFELITKIFSIRPKRQALPSVAQSDFDMDETFVPPEVIFSNENITAAIAKCENFFNSSSIAKLCVGVASPDSSNTSKQSCVDDLLATGSDEWMNATLENLKHSCLQEISQDESIDANLVEQIGNESCPNQCSRQGSCANGNCSCNHDFTGPDCAFNMSASISLIDFYSTCDLTQEKCSYADVRGLGLIPGLATCHILPVNVTESSVVIDGSWSTTETIFVSENEVLCYLPAARSYYVLVKNEFQLSTSKRQSRAVNDPDADHSNLFIVADPTCYDCNNTGVYSSSCKRLNNTCVIAGSCYGPGQENPSDKCLTCQPETSDSSWSPSDAFLCSHLTPVSPSSTPVSPSSDDNKIKLILGLCLGLGLGIIAILLALLIYKWKCAGKSKSKDLYKARCSDASFNPYEHAVNEYD